MQGLIDLSKLPSHKFQQYTHYKIIGGKFAGIEDGTVKTIILPL
jgi:hypothetical protein